MQREFCKQEIHCIENNVIMILTIIIIPDSTALIESYFSFITLTSLFLGVFIIAVFDYAVSARFSTQK